MGGGPTDPHEVEETLRVLRLHTVEGFLIVAADGVISTDDIYHEELAIVISFHSDADVTLIDSLPPTRYLVLCECKVSHTRLLP